MEVESEAVNWKIDYRVPEVPETMVQAGFPPLLASVLALRGITGVEEANERIQGSRDRLHDPFGILGMETAVRRLRQAMETKEHVAVYGDYDVDGITATCLLSDYLSGKGLSVEPYIPDRNDEGYGLNRSALDKFRDMGVTLVVTVDCGITAVEETLYARSLGIDMLITDHHECKGGALPAAAAVIDCRQPGDTYPNPHLAGVGMAFKLACACEGRADLLLKQYADLVAIGTIADVMLLEGENRFLVRKGIEQLRTEPRLGLAAMLKECGIDRRSVNSSAIGFNLAPRLNAAGRLGQAIMAKDLVMSRDAAEAARLAAELCELNRERQKIENRIWKQATAQVGRHPPSGPIVLASDTWHQGVIGIAASRLAEQYAVPTIMIYLGEEVGKGSCRSYGGFNLFNALSACSEHLVSFGGHALAAGLNIRRDKIEDFRAAIRAYYETHRPEDVPDVVCDLLITDPSLLSVENVRSLDRLEPYGNGNPKPVLCLLGVRLQSFSDVGHGKHLKLTVDAGGTLFDAIFFSHTSESFSLHEGDRLDLAFQPQINEFRGRVSVQLSVCALRVHDGSELCRDVLETGGTYLRALSPYLPERADFVRVWKHLGSSFSLGETPEAVLSLCPEGMLPETFCLCLAVFREAGLITGGPSLCGASSQRRAGKADLEATVLQRRLRSLRPL